LTVKKLTSSVASGAGSSTVPAAASVHGVSTGGKTRTMTSMIKAASSPVTTKTPSVAPRMRPALRRERVLAMLPASEQNTSGTTRQNIMLMNTVPSGSRQTAPGQAAPTAQPSTIHPSIAARKP